MKTLRFISLFLAAALITLSGSEFEAYADEKETDFYEQNNAEEDIINNTEKDTVTLYLLAPENWFMKEYGAKNEYVSCYWWKYENGDDFDHPTYEVEAPFPGEKMIPVPELGFGVFKITGVPNGADLMFNDFYKYDDEGLEATYRPTTMTIYTGEREKNGSFSGRDTYNKDLFADDYDGWIYIIHRRPD